MLVKVKLAIFFLCFFSFFVFSQTKCEDKTGRIKFRGFVFYPEAGLGIDYDEVKSFGGESDTKFSEVAYAKLRIKKSI